MQVCRLEKVVVLIQVGHHSLGRLETQLNVDVNGDFFPLFPSMLCEFLARLEEADCELV